MNRKLLEKTADKEARKLAFEKDERAGIKEYKKAIKRSTGKEKKTYQSILPQEKSHLRRIKKI